MIRMNELMNNNLEGFSVKRQFDIWQVK